MPRKTFFESIKRRSVSLSLIALFLIAGATITSVSMLNQPKKKFDFKPSEAEELDDYKSTDVKLTDAKFDTAKSVVTGNVEVSFALRDMPTENSTPDQMETAITRLLGIMKIKDVSLRFFHGKEGKMLSGRGGSDKMLEMRSDEPFSIQINGRGTFAWRAEIENSSFWYPFDSYRVYVKPKLLRPSGDEERVDGLTPISAYVRKNTSGKKDAEKNAQIEEIRKKIYVTDEVDTLSIEFDDNSLFAEKVVKNYESLEDKRFFDPYEVTIYRPFLTRASTVFIGVLMLFGLIYLYFFKDIESSAGDLLGFFVGVLGTRAILLTGVDFSPVFLDYVVILVAIFATGIVFSRWMDKRLAKETRFNCPYCREKMSLDALACPHCANRL